LFILQIWGDDSDNEEEESGENELPEEKNDKGAEAGEKEMSAKDDSRKPLEEPDDQETRTGDQKKKEINEMEEPEVDEDHVDPYHGVLKNCLLMFFVSSS
jgi:midasin